MSGYTVILDTETTGFGPRSEVLELAIIDADSGAVLYDSPVMPEGRIPAAASDVHGLTRAELKRMDARPWPEHHTAVCEILAGADAVLAYNTEYDRRLLEQTANRYGLALPEELSWRCVMLGYADGGRWIKLAKACKREGIAVSGAHRALADARLTRELYRRMATDAVPLDRPEAPDALTDDELEQLVAGALTDAEVKQLVAGALTDAEVKQLVADALTDDELKQLVARAAAEQEEADRRAERLDAMSDAETDADVTRALDAMSDDEVAEWAASRKSDGLGCMVALAFLVLVALALMLTGC